MSKQKCKSCSGNFECTDWPYPENCDACQPAITALAVSTAREAASMKALSAVRRDRELAIETIKSLSVGTMIRNPKVVRSGLYWLLAWFAIGVGWTFYERSDNKLVGCVYRSIAPFTNPGYLAACELFRERWEIGKRPVSEVRSDR